MKSVMVLKEQAVADLSAIAKQSHSMVAVHYRGMKVSSMTALRSAARKQNVYVKIIKNTLARRALSDSQYAGTVDKIVGPIVLAFSMESPGDAAKLMREFVKNHDILEVQVIGVESGVYPASALSKIADMPNKEQAIAILLGAFQSPIRKLACTLQETYATLVRVVDQVAKKRESQQ
jgi:large subunit ribosomal protein L10